MIVLIGMSDIKFIPDSSPTQLFLLKTEFAIRTKKGHHITLSNNFTPLRPLCMGLKTLPVSQ